MVTKTTINIEDYIKEIDQLTPDEQLNLIEIILARLKSNLKKKLTEHSIMELQGLGAHIWKNIDAQQYVNKERKSWD